MTIDYLTRPRPLAPRQDILPVIIGGDFGVYGIGRCFNEASDVAASAWVPSRPNRSHGHTFSMSDM